MKALIFSDLHVKPDNVDITLGILEEIYKEAAAINVNAIIFLGDLFHLRYHIPVELLNAVAERIWNLTVVADVRLLPGNHDQIDVKGTNALEVLGRYDGVTVHTNPAVDSWGLWLPYRKDPKTMAQAIKDCHFDSKTDKRVLFAHLPLRGAMMNNRMPDEDGFPRGMVAPFDFVFLGHYHKRQPVEIPGNPTTKCLYVGSPWQTRADEYGQAKGFVVWDTVLESATFYTREWGPRYHRFDTEEELEHTSVNSGDHVHVAPSLAGHVTTMPEFLQEDLHITIGAEEEDVEARFGFGKGTTLSEYAKVYAEKNHGSLDEAKLLALFEALL